MASSLLDSEDDEEGHSSGDFHRHSTPRKTSSSDFHLFPRRLSSSLSSHSSAPSSTSSSGNSSMTSSSSSTTSSSLTSFLTSNSTFSLATVLDVFQHPISEHQAWALVYLAALSLKHLVTDYYNSESGSAELLKIVEVSDVADLLLTPSGTVHPSTWLQKTKKRDEIVVKNSRSLNSAFAHLSGLVYKALTYKLLKSPGEKKASLKGDLKRDVLLETNLDSLESEYVSAVEDNEDEEDDLEPDINTDLESVLIYMIRSKDDSNADLNDDHQTSEETGDDEGIDDDHVEDEEEDQDEGQRSLSSVLAKSALPSVLKRCERHFEEQWSELLMKNAVASSNGHELPGGMQKPLSLNSTSTSISSCPILTMLYEGSRKCSKTTVDATVYYTAVIEQMLDEYGKLKQLLKQLEIEELANGAGCDNLDGQLAFRRSSVLLSKSGGFNSELLPDTESLKVWAQTWIRVMSEMRFGGVHLRQVNLAEPDPRMKPSCSSAEDGLKNPPFNALMEQIRSTRKEHLRSSKEVHPRQQFQRQLLQHSRSLPCLDYRLTINQEVIRAKKSSLKPAERRKLAERPPPEPCLHDRLMAEIKEQGGDNKSKRRLTSVETIVKPDIVELYFKERREMQKKRAVQSKSFPRVKSAIVLPRVHSPTFTKENSEQQQQQNQKQFSMDELASISNVSSTNSLLRLCGRCSSVNSSFEVAEQEKKLAVNEIPEAEEVHKTSFLQRFRSLSVSKLAKRKNQASDDSFNTSLPHTPEKSTTIISTLNNNFSTLKSNNTRQQKRLTKKSRPQSEHAFISSPTYSSSPIPPSPLLATYNSSTFHSHHHHGSSSRHSPIPAQWITKPSTNGSTSNSSYKSPPCLRHNSRATSNPSFVHSVAVYPCTCQTTPAAASKNSINFEASPQTPPQPSLIATSRLFSSHFQANLHLRRSYIKSKHQQQILQSQVTQLPSSTFDQHSSIFQTSSRLRRANSVMFHSRADRTSSTSSSVLSKSQSKWSISNLLSKITSSIGSPAREAKVKRE